jgi:hypothetical protein
VGARDQPELLAQHELNNSPNAIGNCLRATHDERSDHSSILRQYRHVAMNTEAGMLNSNFGDARSLPTHIRVRSVTRLLVSSARDFARIAQDRALRATRDDENSGD